MSPMRARLIVPYAAMDAPSSKRTSQAICTLGTALSSKLESASPAVPATRNALRRFTTSEMRPQA